MEYARIMNNVPMTFALELPFPAKCLWPNGRAHWGTKSKAFAKHKHWAYLEMRSKNPDFPYGRVSWHIFIRPKTKHVIDADNAIASMKAYADGIALALGVDDGTFNAPTVTFVEPTKGGHVVIYVTA